VAGTRWYTRDGWGEGAWRRREGREGGEEGGRDGRILFLHDGSGGRVQCLEVFVLDGRRPKRRRRKREPWWSVTLAVWREDEWKVVVVGREEGGKR